MAYAHYWRLHVVSDSGDWIPEAHRKTFRKVIADVDAILQASGLDPLRIGNERAPADWQGGLFYLVDADSILLDESIGAVGLTHEMFMLDLDGMWRGRGDDTPHVLGSCRTARRSYDPLVGASLMSIKHHFGDAAVITSDGHWEPDWTGGVAAHPIGYTPQPEYTVSPVELYQRVFPSRAIDNILRA